MPFNLTLFSTIGFWSKVDIFEIPNSEFKEV